MRKSKRNKLPPFVALIWEMLNSKAYIDLPPSAAKALPYFLGKPKFSYSDPQRYKEEFSFSYKEAKKYGFAIATHHRSICELVEKGFIDPVDRGGLRGLGKSCSLFTLSWRWRDYGTPEFKKIEWRCFLPRQKSKSKAKMEMNNNRNGNKTNDWDKSFSKNDAAEAVSV